MDSPRRTIRVVNVDKIADISDEILDIAQAQLVRARVCGNEAHITFNFLQKVLHELQRRRREEAELACEIDEMLAEGLDEIDESPGVIVAEDIELIDNRPPKLPDPPELLPEPEPEPLKVNPEEDTAILTYHPTPSSERVIRVSDAPVRRTPLTSRQRGPGINGWRVLGISAAAVLLMICGVICAGCGDRKRYYSTGPTYVEQIGPCLVTYKGETAPVTSCQRVRARESARAHVLAFETDWGALPEDVLCDIYVNRPGKAAPCGAYPNGGGCFTPQDKRIWVVATEDGDVDDLYHELLHAHLFLRGIEPDGDVDHSNPAWAVARRRWDELRADYRARRHQCADDL